MSEATNQIGTQTKTDDLSGRFLTFMLGGSVYGLPLHDVIEIISIQGITKVPMLPAYISGIINLRGKIVPVVDIRVKLGMEVREFDMYTCIVVVNIGDLNVGLIVDKVNAVISADANAMTTPPTAISDTGVLTLSSIINIEGKVALIIALEKLFGDELDDAFLEE